MSAVRLNCGFSRQEHPLSTPMTFHIHSEFELYFFLQGDVRYFVEKTVYPLQPGDLLLLNSNELHKATFMSDLPYERFVCHFQPEQFNLLADFGVPLLALFTDRPSGENNPDH